jgi:hypothetical protein
LRSPQPFRLRDDLRSLPGQQDVGDQSVFQTGFHIPEERLKIVEKYAVKNGAFRMTWAVNSAHGRDSYSKNVPGRRND